MGLQGQIGERSPEKLEVQLFTQDTLDMPLLDTLLVMVVSPVLTLTIVYISLALRRHRRRKRDLAPTDVVMALPSREYVAEKPSTEQPGASFHPLEATTSRAEAEVESVAESAAEDPDCVVCLDVFRTGDLVTTLPCSHEYHSACIVPWLTRRKRLCPICKRDIMVLSSVLKLTSSEQTPLREQSSDSTTYGAV